MSIKCASTKEGTKYYFAPSDETILSSCFYRRPTLDG